MARFPFDGHVRHPRTLARASRIVQAIGMVMRAPGPEAPWIAADQLTESDRLELSDGKLIH
jgi:hypothetical protein